MPYKDIEKRREVQRRWYQKNREKHIKGVRTRRLALKEGVQEYKRTLSCIECGETHTACLDFHHTDPSTKRGHPCQMYANCSWSLHKLIDYLKTFCVVLCANCHRKHHHEERLEKKARRVAGKKTRRGKQGHYSRFVV